MPILLERERQRKRERVRKGKKLRKENEMRKKERKEWLKRGRGREEQN